MPIDILIITALPEELEALRHYLPLKEKKQSETCQLTYDIGPLQTENEGVSFLCAATCLFRMGNTDAGVSAANALHDLNPTYVIMFGLAAGIEGEVELGDVILPTHVFYYELAKLSQGKVHVRPQSYQSDDLLINKLSDFASTYAGDHKVIFGPFAVGEKVVAEPAAVENLKQADPKLIGIEMESYGVARAAANMLYRPRFIAIRGVCDYADNNKNDDFRSLALINAAKFANSFLRTGVLPKEKPKATASEIQDTLIIIHHLSLDKRASVKSFFQQDSLEYSGLEVKEILIDQTSLYNDGVLSNPTEALIKQSDLIDQLNGFYDAYPTSRIGYFGLAHIPLMFHAGYQVNRRHVNVFATNRQTGAWLSLKESGRGPMLRLEEAKNKSSVESGDVIIRVSMSYLVREEQIQGFVNNPLASYHLRLDKPKPDIVKNNEQLNRYARLFYDLLVEINARFPNTNQIHLFMSAPPAVTFRFGQQVSKTIDPQILVYNYSNKDHPSYGWAINIMANEVIDFRSRK